MPMKPRKDETQSEFTARCVPDMMGPDKDKRPQEQAVAICLDIWRNKDKAMRKVRNANLLKLKYDITPEDDEDENDFMERCEIDHEENECERIWQETIWDELAAGGEERAHKEASMAKQDDDDIAPQDGESEDDFLDRCSSEGYDDDYCERVWEELGSDNEEAAMGEIKHKTHAGIINGTEFVLSDDTPDRMGDVIEAGGWQLDEFNKNPVALFGHKADFPIGRWLGVGVKGNQLRGHLELAPKGTSPRIDEIRALVKAGILRAVSVGFKPLDFVPINPRDPFSGARYSRQELVECSLVAVPANPNALSIAKSLQISDETRRLVFAKSGNGTKTKQTVGRGKLADKTPVGRNVTMTPLSQRITDAQSRITALRTALADHLSSVDDNDVSEEQIVKTTEFNNKIVQEERTLAMLVDSEKHIAASTAAETKSAVTAPAASRTGLMTSARPFSMPTKKIDPIELLVRACTVQMFSHIRKTNIDDTRAWLAAQNNPQYNDDVTRAYIDWTVKAVANPAMTTVVGWAAELVQTVYAAFMESLFPKSVYPRLAAKGIHLTFGTAGKISIPTRSLTPTIAGSFVGEGAAIPVRQGAFTAQVLVPKKMAVITTWTREMSEHSVPAIEGLLRQAIQDDTAIAIDSVLLDANAATAIRPAGLLNGVTPTTPTAGGGFTALVGDIKNLTGALLTATRGNVRAPCFIMNPQQVMTAGLTPAPASGVFPFDTSGGTLNGWPIIDSGTVPLGTMIAMDAADFVGTGDNPRFEISDQATLHEEDTAPLPIVGAGSPGTVAAPVRSLWQTDSLGLRLVLPLNWLNRRPGTVAVVNGVTW